MPTLDELITLEDFRQWVKNSEAPEAEFLRICSKLEVGEYSGSSTRVLVYTGNEPAILRALGSAGSTAPSGVKRAREEDDVDYSRVKVESHAPPSSSSAKLVERKSSGERQPKFTKLRNDQPGRRGPNNQSKGAQTLARRAPDFYPRLDPQSEPEPLQDLYRNAVKDPRLMDIWKVHNYWCRELEHRWRCRVESLYRTCVPCRDEPLGLCDRYCNHMHGIELMLFVVSGALLRHGYEWHRSVRVPMNDLGLTKFEPRVCITWALRCVLNPSLKCLEGRTLGTCATKRFDLSSGSGNRVHSMWILEQWASRLYSQTSKARLTDEVATGMYVLGLGDVVEYDPKKIVTVRSDLHSGSQKGRLSPIVKVEEGDQRRLPIRGQEKSIPFMEGIGTQNERVREGGEAQRITNNPSAPVLEQSAINQRPLHLMTYADLVNPSGSRPPLDLHPQTASQSSPQAASDQFSEEGERGE